MILNPLEVYSIIDSLSTDLTPKAEIIFQKAKKRLFWLLNGLLRLMQTGNHLLTG